MDGSGSEDALETKTNLSGIALDGKKLKFSTSIPDAMEPKDKGKGVAISFKCKSILFIWFCRTIFFVESLHDLTSIGEKQNI